MNKKISLIMASVIATILISYTSAFILSNQAFANSVKDKLNKLPQGDTISIPDMYDRQSSMHTHTHTPQ